MNDSVPHPSDREDGLLASYAMHSNDSLGRKHPESTHAYRGPFQRDRDRILHCSAFRRLAGKMQVFTGDMGDYHRTRLTHTFEVASIARTIGRVLRLNEDLIEALALMHDIGHPPYGHCGEDVLHDCMRQAGGFSHNQFALTIVEDLEQRFNRFSGLNLSAEVLAGQTARANKHQPANVTAPLLEVQVVDAADSMAYDAHDIDDAVQLGLLTIEELARVPLVERALRSIEAKYRNLPPKQLRPALVHELVDLQVSNFLEFNIPRIHAAQGKTAAEVREEGLRVEEDESFRSERRELEKFLFDNIYRHSRLLEIRRSAGQRLEQLHSRLVDQPDRLPLRFRQRASSVGPIRAVGEYIAGMTDRFCDLQHEYLFSGAGPLADW
ncbi:Deoxyguanosinetriphosphate triphosphohydrolase [Rosistilla oblonga]|uniref:Deoxyguanosinetriphosphate triphosphohydrolase-like protein n=1 Tax=Rosistilla oblonga TaxID=2527990 RepID=A0A518IYP9_9BACT|nr:dNTP triphosphohydrolase [Rosistilla oblonga]QDV13593.1 Deoxyguanosinetriphosphate triphosphohydrolase [Rosistilla oblonga]QDV58215.1 Deoxyguanosinetriphosphate triphosphohydrolase [Rosistilla oblonga]